MINCFCGYCVLILIYWSWLILFDVLLLSSLILVSWYWTWCSFLVWGLMLVWVLLLTCLFSDYLWMIVVVYWFWVLVRCFICWFLIYVFCFCLNVICEFFLGLFDCGVGFMMFWVLLLNSWIDIEFSCWFSCLGWGKFDFALVRVDVSRFCLLYYCVVLFVVCFAFIYCCFFACCLGWSLGFVSFVIVLICFYDLALLISLPLVVWFMIYLGLLLFWVVLWFTNYGFGVSFAVVVLGVTFTFDCFRLCFDLLFGWLFVYLFDVWFEFEIVNL